MKNEFKYGIFDGTIILVTHFHFLKARGQLSKGRLTTAVFQTIVKTLRDICTCDKVIVCWDSPPYHRTEQIEWYKANRFHITKEFVEDLKKTKPCTLEEQTEYVNALISESQDKSPEELEELINEYIEEHPTEEKLSEKIAQAEKDLAEDLIKLEARAALIENLGNLGVLSLAIPGYEADDLAYLTLRCKEASGDLSKCYLCTKDSDWEYLLTPNTEIIKYHKGDTFTYEDVLNKIDEDVRALPQFDLFRYKATFDAVYGSHNNHQCSRTDEEIDFNGIYEAAIRRDTDFLEKYVDTDVFYPQYDSFFLESYPDLEEAKKTITSLLNSKAGCIADEQGLRIFSSALGLRVSESYYRCFTSILNPEEYQPYVPIKETSLDELFDSL